MNELSVLLFSFLDAPDAASLLLWIAIEFIISKLCQSAVICFPSVFHFSVSIQCFTHCQVQSLGRTQDWHCRYEPESTITSSQQRSSVREQETDSGIGTNYEWNTDYTDYEVIVVYHRL